MKRREFLKQAGVLGVAVAAARCSDRAIAVGPRPNSLPMISLGGLKVSRVFLGSNPFFGFSHGNPQASADEMRQWYTPQRVMVVMDEAADLGINAVWTPCYEHWVRLWNEYREKGGKLEHWIAQPDRRPMEDEIMTAIKNRSPSAVKGSGVNRQTLNGVSQS